MLRYLKTKVCLVKHLKVVAKGCLNWIFFIFLNFYGNFYCYVKYSNVKTCQDEYQDEIFKTCTKKFMLRAYHQKQMARFGSRRKLHNLDYFEPVY